MRFKDSLFARSFKKINRHVLHIMMYDLLNIVFIALGFLLWIKILGNKAQQLGIIDMNSLIYASQAELSQNLALIKGFVIAFFVLTVLFIVYLILVWSFFSLCVWCKILRKKLTEEYYVKFLLLNVAMAIIGIPVFLFIAYLIAIAVSFVTPENIGGYLIRVYVLMIYFIAAFSLVQIVYYYFTEKPKIKSIVNALSAALKKKMAVSYIAAASVFFVLSYISNLMVVILPDRIAVFIDIILILLYLAWLRIYIVGCVGKMKKR